MKKDNKNIRTIDWEKLSSYLSGEMHAKEKSDFELFLTKHPTYQDALASADADESLDFDTKTAWKKLSSNIKRWELDQEQHAIIKRKMPQSFYRIAAVVLAIVSLSITSYLLVNNAQTKERIFTASSSEQNKSITLNDGTVVYLNANAKLYYTKVFEGSERKVTFEGEGFFDVAANKDKPFIIETHNAKITVVGTSFNLIGTSTITKVMVTSGHVTLSKPDDEATAILLQQGEEGTLEDHKVLKREATNNNYLSWRTQQMVFNETPLREVFQVIENTYAVNIRMEASADTVLYLTATFDHEPLNILLESIERTFNLTYRTEGRSIIFDTKK